MHAVQLKEPKYLASASTAGAGRSQVLLVATQPPCCVEAAGENHGSEEGTDSRETLCGWLSPLNETLDDTCKPVVDRTKGAVSFEGHSPSTTYVLEAGDKIFFGSERYIMEGVRQGGGQCVWDLVQLFLKVILGTGVSTQSSVKLQVVS